MRKFFRAAAYVALVAFSIVAVLGSIAAGWATVMILAGGEVGAALFSTADPRDCVPLLVCSCLLSWSSCESMQLADRFDSGD